LGVNAGGGGTSTKNKKKKTGSRNTYQLKDVLKRRKAMGGDRVQNGKRRSGTGLISWRGTVGEDLKNGGSDRAQSLIGRKNNVHEKREEKKCKKQE